MENLEVNAAIWETFMSVTLQAAVHLGKDYSENLRSVKSQTKRSLKQLFHVAGELTTDQKEIAGIPVIVWQLLMWQRTTLLTDKAFQFATAETYVFSDSVLCMGGPDPVRAWKEKINWKPVALQNLETMVMPPKLSTTNQTSQTDARVQGNLLREYEQRFGDLPEYAQLTKLCSNAGLAKTVEKKGQYFTTLDDEQRELKGSCREYALPRSDSSSQVKGWIRGNTKIGPVLDVMVCYHQELYDVEIKIESLFSDGTRSWVMIVNGINKYVTGTLDEVHVEIVGEKSTGNPVTRARPRQASNLTLSPVPIPYRERQWMDVEPGTFDRNCLEVSKLMPRHDDSINREEDGAVRFE